MIKTLLYVDNLTFKTNGCGLYKLSRRAKNGSIQTVVMHRNVVQQVVDAFKIAEAAKSDEFRLLVDAANKGGK